MEDFVVWEKGKKTNTFRPRGWHRNCMDTVFQFLFCWNQVYWHLQSGHRWLRDPRTPQTELVGFFCQFCNSTVGVETDIRISRGVFDSQKFLCLLLFLFIIGWKQFEQNSDWEPCFLFFSDRVRRWIKLEKFLIRQYWVLQPLTKRSKFTRRLEFLFLL